VEKNNDIDYVKRLSERKISKIKRNGQWFNGKKFHLYNVD